MESQYNTKYKDISNDFVKICIQKFFDIMLPNQLSFIEWEYAPSRRVGIMDNGPLNRFYIIFDGDTHLDRDHDPAYVVDYDDSIVKHFETNPMAIMHRDFYQRIDSLDQATEDNFEFDWASVAESDRKARNNFKKRLTINDRLAPEDDNIFGDHTHSAEELLRELRKSRGEHKDSGIVLDFPKKDSD